MYRHSACFFIAVLSSHLVSCNGDLSVTLTKQSTPLSVVNSAVTVLAKPGDSVELTGQGFKESQKYIAKIALGDGTFKEVPLTVKDSETAIFVLPDGLGLGEKSYEVFQGTRKLKELNIVADSQQNKLPIYTASQSDMCTTVQYINAKGETVRGTKDCDAGSVLDCTGDGLSGCKTTDQYKSIDYTNITPANIRSGVVIGGVTGDYPSATNPLGGADGTADLDTATFNAKIKSASAFEYWNSSGSRQIGSGDSDIAAANIKDSVSIFGELGTYTGVAPNAWDIRAGVTVSGVTGKLKTDCRNGAILGTYDAALPIAGTVNSSTDTITINSHGFSDNQTVRVNFSTQPTPLDNSVTYYVRNSTSNTFQLSTTSGGTVVNITTNGSAFYVMPYANGLTDLWDSIDDDIGATTSHPTNSGWTSNNFCGGIETVTDDANVWKDVTSTGDGVNPSSCSATAAHCSFKDKISGHEWHNPDATLRNWTQGIEYCDTLNYNGKTDWRMPTEKELMQANINGIVSTVGTTNWITLSDINRWYWTATSKSNGVGMAWRVYLGNGSTDYFYTYKNDSYRVICVRP